jgi:hypothetical protein
MPGTGLPKGSKRKQKSRKGSRKRRQRQRTLLAWSFLLGLIVIGVFAGAVGLWLLPKVNDSSAHTSQKLDADEPRDRVVSRFPSPTESESLEKVKQAMALRDSSAVSDYFRLGAATPEQVVDFLQELEAGEGPVTDFGWLSSIDANHLSIDGVVVIFKGSEQPSRRLALLTPDEQGVWKIDFDALARSVTPAWEDFIDQAETSVRGRVYITRDSYYNGPFRDDQRWVCYGIRTPDLDETFFGYCEIGSAQHAAIEAIFVRDTRVIRATLELRRPQDAGPRQLVISRVLAEDWVINEAGFFDETFE